MMNNSIKQVKNMTQEEKQLLFKDLCARLPYGVKVKVFDESILLESKNNENGILDGKEIMSDDCFVIKCKNDSWIISCEDFKPYLRPMSSMTDEEIKYKLSNFFKIINTNIEGVGYKPTLNTFNAIKFIDWLNTNHFDYHGLIEKGMALEAPEGMYKTE